MPSHHASIRRWILIVMLLAGLLPAAAAGSSPQAPPAGLTPVEWRDIQAQLPPSAPAQEAYLKSGNVGADDGLGYAVAVSGDTLVVSAPKEDSGTTGVNTIPNEAAPQAGAAYVFVRSGATWVQQAYLKAANAEKGDSFGFSVAIDGDTIVVGATQEDSATTGVNTTPNEAANGSGAAYVFVRSGTTWTQQAYLKASNAGPDDSFGVAVAVSGDTIVVGAYGEDSNTTGVNSTPNNALSLAGAAYVFGRAGSAWTQQAYLKASNTGVNNRFSIGSLFGSSVAIDGDTIVVGAYQEDNGTTDSDPTGAAHTVGAAYVFVRTGATWSQQAYLKASNAGSEDYFAQSVAISGDTIVIGANGEDSGATGVNGHPNEEVSWSGAAYVFVRSGVTWFQQAYLKASNTGETDVFGWSVAVDGDTIVVGANQEDSGTAGVNPTPNEAAPESGAAY
ncbi:MAG TPA: FG-GAP repeat protein, partial [Herpetosiphonaceae bacterium]|nr:FG-GAP repeat protein [Herpetosiphonaceae bacterium]